MGPSAAVFLSQPLTTHQKEQIKTLCGTLGDNLKIRDGDCWFNLQNLLPLGIAWPFEPDGLPPISLHFADIHEDNTPEELQLITQCTGFTIHQQLVVTAHTTGQSSHYALGALTLHLAQRHQGLIDFDGVLDDTTFSVRSRFPPGIEVKVQHRMEQYAQFFQGHAGQLWAIPFSAEHGSWFQHYGDAAFMRWWLNHPQFRMVK